VSNRIDHLALSPGQALYVLSCLLENGKVTRREIEKLALQMDAEIAKLEARLASLRGTLPSAKSKDARRARPITDALEESRRIQGEYMGLVRHLKPRERARIKKVAAQRGREAAIRAMRSIPRLAPDTSRAPS
jgi:hypothetical protein